MAFQGLALKTILQTDNMILLNRLLDRHGRMRSFPSGSRLVSALWGNACEPLGGLFKSVGD
jgi:hypothetical protein